jgi:5'-nucleotidase/UDP-sugar diphosphatase
VSRLVRICWAWFLCAAFSCAQNPVQSFSILHTNDLHAHLLPDGDGLGGFAYLAAELRRQRQGCSTCLYLNAGDLVQGTPVSTLFHGLPVYQLANMLGMDAGTLGNHEFDYGWQSVRTFAKAARFPIVSANVVDGQGRLLTGRGYVIKLVAGVRIAIIGAVLGDLVGNYSTVEQAGPWHVVPVADAVRKTVTEVRGRADLIVVLGHLHDEETNQILHGIPEVSIVIAGHDHAGYREMLSVDHRYAVETKSYGVELGRLDFRFDRAAHQVVSAAWKRIPIDSRSIAPAPDVQRKVAFWEAKVSKIVDVPIGEAKRRIERPELRLLVEQAMVDETGADIAFINLGNVRTFLPQGRLLARHIWDVLPFDNYIVTGSFRGSELPAAVTKDFPVEKDRVYKLAVTDFAAANQASKDQMESTGLKFPVKGPLQRDAVLDWIRKKKVVE